MTSPWHVLGIARGSSLAEVKKAYARLLRQHRPDQDPVGFRRLRDAYELAVRMVESGLEWPEHDHEHEEQEEEEQQGEQAVVVDDQAPDADSRPALPSRAAPEQVDPAVANSSHEAPPRPGTRDLGKARIEVVRPRPRDLAEALRRALARVRAVPHPPREQRLLRLLANLLQRRPRDFALGELALEELALEGSVLRRLLPPEVAFGASRIDGLPLARTLLLAHLAANDLASFYGAVDAVARNLETSAEPHQLAAATDAARAVALLDPARAERLTDLVFLKAPAGLRSAFGDVDAFVQAGRQLRERQLRDHLPEVVLALLDPGVADDDPRAHRVLEFVVAAARAPDLAALVAERFPTAWPQYEPKWRRNRASRTKRQEPQKRRSFGRYLVMIWLVLTVLGAIVRACRDDRPPKFRFERNAPGQWSSSIGLPPDSPR